MTRLALAAAAALALVSSADAATPLPDCPSRTVRSFCKPLPPLPRCGGTTARSLKCHPNPDSPVLKPKPVAAEGQTKG